MDTFVGFFVVENRWHTRGLGLDCGWGNGYAIISRSHPYFDMSYEDMDVSVHGGLTYGGFAENWTEVPSQFRDRDHYVVGFDTSHYGDTLIKWPRERVVQEAKMLAMELYFIQLRYIRKQKNEQEVR